VEKPVGEVGQVTAVDQRFTDNKHAEEKKDDIQIDGLDGIQRRDLQRRQYGNSAGGHDLPDLKVELTNPPDNNQNKNNRENNYWNHLLPL